MTAPTLPTPPPVPPATDHSVRNAVLVAVIGGVLAGCLIGVVGTAVLNGSRPSGPSVPVASDGGQPDASGDYSPLAQGTPGAAVAAAPLNCEGACFDETSAELAILDDREFKQRGLPTFKHTWNMTGDRSTAAERQASELDTWRDSGFSPDECFVTWADSPVVEPEGTALGDDVIAPLSEHSSEVHYGSVLTQSVRLFPDTASAISYMATLSQGILACTRYHDPNGYPVDVITKEPGLVADESVAAVGFVRSPVSGNRIYVMDIQRANMVIRSVAISNGGISDNTFRPLMQAQADLMAGLTPVNPVVE